MVDRIVQLKEGRILAQGNFETLKTALSLIESVQGIEDGKIVDHSEVWGDTGKFLEGVNLGKEEEDRKRGMVSLKVYLSYLLYGASPFVVLAVLVMYFTGAG